MEHRPIPAALARGPFSTGTALQHVTPDMLRGPAYRRLLRGVHVADGPVTHAERIQAAREVLPAEAVLAGRSALWVYGVRVADPDDPVEVLLPAERRVRSRRHVRVRAERLLPDEVTRTRVGSVTTPVRTAFDIARAASPLMSVPLLDALGRATGVRRADVTAVAGAHPRARGARRVDPALGLVDAGAESLRESALRVAIVLAGLPRPGTQVRILTVDGHFVARCDLGWPELRVVVEYDGAHHDEREQVIRDRARLNAVRLAG